MRGDQLSRQWRILCRIEASRTGLTAAEIAQLADSSLRTAYRDLDDLQAAGFPLYTDKEDKAQRWKFVDTYRLRLPYPFTLTELISLQLSRDLFRVFEGTAFHESLMRFFDKITAALPPESMAFLDRVRAAFHMGSLRCRDYGCYREIVSRVNKAVLDRHTIEIAYQGLADKTPVLRKVDAYKIWFCDGIELTLRVAGLDEIRQWILSMGPDAYVVAPEALRDMIRDSLKTTLSQYLSIESLFKMDEIEGQRNRSSGTSD